MVANNEKTQMKEINEKEIEDVHCASMLKFNVLQEDTEGLPSQSSVLLTETQS